VLRVTLFLGEINMGTWPFRMGGVSNVRVKYGHESGDSDPETDCADEAYQQLLTTDSSASD
jgi:hypothetical protein